MKNRRVLALIAGLTISTSMVTSAAAWAASADTVMVQERRDTGSDQNNDAGSQMPGNGGMMNGQRPQMPGNDGTMNGQRPQMPGNGGSMNGTDSGRRKDSGSDSAKQKTPGNSSTQNEPPAKPDGQAPNGQMPEGQAPDGQMPEGQAPGMPGQNGPGSGEAEQGSAAATISEDSKISGETYTSEGDDENALRIEGASVTLENITVEKTGGSSSNVEAGDFYGMNAGLLATDGAEVVITGADISTSAQNGNGVFSYGEGTTVTISDSVITTTADNSGGIQTTGGGTTNASNLTVETSGNSSAAIRSDRGGGTVTVDGGTYTSSGYNSPAVYSTAAIDIANAALTANNSEALVIEGKNSISLTDCDVTGNMSDDKGASSKINVHNVMIYQSMSGDAAEGTSSFSMDGGTLTSLNGDMFYITNTACTIDLTGVEIINEDKEANLLTVTGNDASHGWGTAGQNGGSVTLTCTDQTLEGSIVVDSISTLDMTLSGESSFTGTISIPENAEGGEAVSENVAVTIEEGSVWSLTGDSEVTSLTNNGTIEFNGFSITLADGTVLSE